MTSLEKMMDFFSQTKLYDTSASSSNFIEFKQYSTFFDFWNSDLNDLLDNCFVETINTAGFEAYRKLYSLPLSTSIAALRRLVTARISITSLDFTIEGVKRCLASGGITASIREDFAANKVFITVTNDENIFGDDRSRTDFIKSCIPCHVEVVIA